MENNNLDTLETQEHLKEYEDAVEYHATNKSKVIFPNPTPAHTSIVLSAMFKHAQKDINLYERDLQGDLMNLNKNFLQNFSDAVNRNIMINFFLENDNNINSNIKDIIDKKPNVKIYKINSIFKDVIQKELGGNFYFALSDKSTFRLEKNDSIEDRRAAMCSFNHKEISGKISKVLNKPLEDIKES